MFSKGKSGAKLLENNAILHHFHVGRLFATGGPEGVWKIYEGYYKTDGKVSSESRVKNNYLMNCIKNNYLMNCMKNNYLIICA